MGRFPTGSITTNEVQKIELSFLLKNGYIQKGKQITASIKWSNNNTINIESKYSSDEVFIRLIYVNKNAETGEITKHNYKIELKSISDNLGQGGEILYFVCPVTGNNCRILYKCYHSEIWKSRTAYSNRIYYKSQIASGFNHFYFRYEQTAKELIKLAERTIKSHYRNQKTRPQQRIETLHEKLLNYKLELEKLKYKIAKTPVDLEFTNELLSNLYFSHYN